MVKGTMYDLEKFGLSEMVECGAALRGFGKSAQTMEEAARGVVTYVRETFGDGAAGHAFALARLYKTHAFGKLPPELQDFARNVFPEEALNPGTRCLTLLATHGEEPPWCDRRQSRGHQAIPLPSKEIVEQLPMVAQLVRQLGLEIDALVSPKLVLDADETSFTVFHVPAALGSAFVPAQKEFVVPHSIGSVLGFGGALPDGDIFAVILFAKVSIPRETAELFRTASLSVKLSLLPFVDRVFAS